MSFLGFLCMFPLILLALALFAFWVWMLVDCATRETPGNPKFGWLLFIALAGVIGAPLYFLLRKLPRKTGK